MREVSTSEVLMTDPTTPEGAAYWQQRHDYEERLERAYQPSLYAVDPEGDAMTDATWSHLSIAHGFGEWTYDELVSHYRSFIIAALHERDHQEHAGEFDLDHDHQEEVTPNER